MLNKDLNYLKSILDAVKKIELYSNSVKSADELYNDSKSFDAVMMNFMIIGEMVSKLSEEFKSKHSQIEWWKIKGLRNIVAHDYFGVDAEEIWQIIENKLPELKTFTKKIIE
jgi:uncharacterized protein with HEPN domain